MRDLLGTVVDVIIDPVHWVNYSYRTELSTAQTVVGGLDLRASSDDDLKALLSDAADPYATLRSAYLQNREGEIQGGANPVPALPDIEDTAPAATAAPPPAPATEPGSPPGPSQAPAPQPRQLSLIQSSGPIVMSARAVDTPPAFETLPSL